MFILGIIGLLVLGCSIFYVFKLNADSAQSTRRPNKPIQWVDLLSMKPTESLTDTEQEVIQYLMDHRRTQVDELLFQTSAKKSTLNQMAKKGYIEIKSDQKDYSLAMLIAGIVILIGSMVLANYYLLVRINARYIGVIFYVVVVGLVIANLVLLYKKVSQDDIIKVNSFTVVGFFVFFILFFAFGGRPYLHAEAYANLIDVSNADFVEDISTVDVDTLPLVDKAYGSKLGSLKLGEYPGIGSEFEAGEYSDIIYQGKQYLVAPLEYRGIFKWFSNRTTGTPGYILIDKVTAETTFVNLKESTGEGLIYTPSAFLNQDLVRHAYYEGMNKYKLENYFFEIDDEGTPYYVLQYSLPTIFINGGAKINKIAVVNALNGDVGIYNPGEEPGWVESVYPNSIIFTQLDYWGSLQDGWLNSVFAQKGVLQPSNGTRVIMNEGELYYFTGLTSAGNDESTIGFVYAGMKTKETRLFRFPGATEDAAMNKVLTLLPQNNISTSFPIPINVEETPTYFILIKGADGRILRYVYISVQDLEIYSMSETESGAYNNYLVKLSETDASATQTISGTITDITSYVSNGNTIYWIELDNDERYKINVSSFSDAQMRYFVGLVISDDIEISVLDYTVVSITIE